MNLSVLPQRLSLIAAVVAFGTVWAVGLSANVAVHTISLRSVMAAGVFWALGFLAGKLVLTSICDAMAQELTRKEHGEKSPSAGGSK